MESVTSQIRSVLISTKGKSELRQLQRDYRMLMGEDIPYRKLGYPNLETFIRNVPTLTVTQSFNGSLLVEAIPTNKTKHMVELINKQKTAKKKIGGSGRLPPRHMSRKSYRAPRNQSPQTPNQQWREQFVNRAKPKPHVHQIVVSIDNSSTEATGSCLYQRLGRSVNMYSPPLISQRTTSTDNLTRKNPRLIRSASSPLGGSLNQPDRHTPPLKPTPPTPSPAAGQEPSYRVPPVLSNESRPRMRYMNNLTTTTSPLQAPMGPNMGVRHPAPTLSRSEMNTLLKEAVAQYDPSGNVWTWSSSTDSSPRNSGSDSTLPTNKAEKQQSSPKEVREVLERRFSDTPTNSSRPSGLPESELLKQLREFARIHKLGEVFVRVLPRGGTKSLRSNIFDCTIKVGNQSFSSYPRDCNSTMDAEEEASRQALAELSPRYEDRKNRKLFLATEDDVLARIPPIIERHCYGVWAAQVALDYEDTFMEQLPPNWLALLDTLQTIIVEPTVDDRYVLKVCKIGEKNIKTEPLNPISNQQLSSEVSVPSNTIRLTEDGWMVDVTFAASTVEVWCRIVGSEDANRFVEANQQMQVYYNTDSNQEHATNISAGGFYVVLFENCWSRVRVLATGEHEVTCFFIDFGDEQVVSKAQIYNLKRQFAREQAQAFVCRLSGLEELANMKTAPIRLVQISGKTFLAKPQLHEAKNESDGPEAISIVLYDSENSDDGDVLVEYDEDVNHLLIRQITNDSVPDLDNLNINRVYVTHAIDKGDLFVQPHCEGFSKITELLTTLDEIDFDKEFPGPHIPLTATSKEDSERVYLARWIQEGGDGNLYRTKVVDRSPCGQYVQLNFIDYGNTQVVHLNNQTHVYALEKISKALVNFPPLAKRIRLDIDPTPGFAEKVLQLMPTDKPVLLKVINTKIDEHGTEVPIVELFRRSESHNELFSVSASLRYGRGGEEGHEENYEDGNNNDKTTQLAKKLERLRRFSGQNSAYTEPVPSTGELATPELPGPGSFLDVRIPFAVNPWNFFVQPYRSAGGLLRLMEQLQERYGDDNRPHDQITLEDVLPGKIYAAKHTDGVWYRTSVIKIINSGSISVFYCDVGYYANLTVQQLIPLEPEFLALPYQAIKARLSGIKPRDAKWSMDDCRHFERLVRGKTFVSVVVAVQQDELYKCDAVLVLRLIDTSTDRDIHVDKKLIDEGIAAQAPN